MPSLRRGSKTAKAKKMQHFTQGLAINAIIRDFIVSIFGLAPLRL